MKVERDFKNLEREFHVKNVTGLWVGVLIYVIGVITIVGSFFLYTTILRNIVNSAYILLFFEVFGLLLLIIGMIYPYRKRISKIKIVCFFVIIILPLSYIGFNLTIFLFSPIGLMVFIIVAVFILLLFIIANL
ncbi:MAG: hypothetical protein KGD58_14290 [Candidatus Lokiarchaeota archaeon]|nr:hypothetical protein [Candidatus Lokiarchaeota archaeon]